MPTDEKTPHESLKPEAKPIARIPASDELARGAPGTQSSSSKRPLAAYPCLSRTRLIVGQPAPKEQLKRTEAFSAVYRRGRWARGSALSVGTLRNRLEATRIGLRTRRGLRGAVERNRLKRQLRTAIYARSLPLRPGLDVVIVIHPKQLPIRSADLHQELLSLCQRAGALS